MGTEGGAGGEQHFVQMSLARWAWICEKSAINKGLGSAASRPGAGASSALWGEPQIRPKSVINAHRLHGALLCKNHAPYLSQGHPLNLCAETRNLHSSTLARFHAVSLYNDQRFLGSSRRSNSTHFKNTSAIPGY